jgi:hypothetical protein
MAAEGRGPLLHTRVGMLRAINHGRERVYSDRKETHCGQAEAEAGWLNLAFRHPALHPAARFPDAACLGFFVVCADLEAPLVGMCYAHV